jgi:hypothetical protein
LLAEFGKAFGLPLRGLSLRGLDAASLISFRGVGVG